MTEVEGCDLPHPAWYSSYRVESRVLLSLVETLLASVLNDNKNINTLKTLTLLDINEIHSSSLANIGTKDSLVTEKVGELSF